MRFFSSRYNYLLLVAIFAIIVAFNFKKPMGFFRESNPALVCINSDFWMKHDSIRKLHIPVTSYAFNSGASIESQLNSTCTTFGYGWFAAPYYFFSITHIPVGDIGIRIFSLCWLLFTLFGVYVLAKKIIAVYQLPKQLLPLIIWFYTLAPTVLWYNVHGYVHETAVLPFYFFAWAFFLDYLHNGNNIKQLLLTGLFLLVGVQFDWLPCLQAFVMAIYLLLNKKRLKNQWAFLVPSLAILLGVAYIFYTYASWAGTEKYIAFMKSKFLSRTVGAGNLNIIPFISHHFNIIIFYAISFGMAAILFIAGLIKRKPKNPIIWLMTGAAFLHHFVFWGFSSEHDHAALKMMFPIAFMAAIFIAALKKNRQLVATLIVLLVNIGLYFFLHNYNYRKGIYRIPRYCSFLGETIKSISTDPNELVFVDTDNKYFPQIEFYAGKSYIMASSIEEAKLFIQKRGIVGKGCFVKMGYDGSYIESKHF